MELFLRCAAAPTAPSNGLLRSLAGARIGAGALAAHGQIAAMAQTAIAADLDQPLDIHLHFAAQIAFDFEILGRYNRAEAQLQLRSGP